MKRILTILALIAALSACRMNNGDIGNLFGTWVLDEITVDGAPYETVKSGEYTWSFQNDIIFIHKLNPHNDYDLYVGTWTDDGRILSLNFTHSDDSTPPGSGHYQAPAALGFEPNAIEPLTWLTNEPRKLVLQYTAPGGKVYKYTLTKTY